MHNFFIAQSVAQSIVQSVETAAQTATAAAQPIDAAQNLGISLRVMGYGMLGIFCIIGIIIFLTWLLQKLFPVKKEED